MVLFVDKCLEYCDIKQYQAICKWRGLKPTLTNIQNFHKQFATTRGKYTVEKEAPLFAEYSARTEWTPNEQQKEKLDTLYLEYLTFSNAHLAKIYGLSENNQVPYI